MNYSSLPKWDRRFLDLANTVGIWSKGPRKRIGAVIVRPDKSVASMGYNGPPRGFDDEAFLAMSRDEQHEVVIHAEDNAIAQMADSDIITYGNASKDDPYTIYISPLYPCSNCAQKIVDSGIGRVVAYCGHSSPDWTESAKAAEEVFKANKIEYIFVTD